MARRRAEQHEEALEVSFVIPLFKCSKKHKGKGVGSKRERVG